MSEVREEEKDWRRLPREKSLRGRLLEDLSCCWVCGRPLAVGSWRELEGDMGVCRLSVRSRLASSSRLLVVDVDTFAIAVSSFSGSGVGGKAPGNTGSGLVGCEFKGPPPAVGGRAVYVAGVSGGVSTCAGAGMLVPAVREKSTGVSVR